MVLSYDDFFTWLMGSQVQPEELKIDHQSYSGRKSAVKVPDEIGALPCKGLERLVGKNLAVSPVSSGEGNIYGSFLDEDFTTFGIMRPTGIVGVFEVPEGKSATNGTRLPLVAKFRARFGEGTENKFLIEYCKSAPKYLGTEAQATTGHQQGK